MEEPKVADQDVKPDPVAQDDKQKSDGIPYSRFKEVNDALKETQAELAKLRDSQEKARRAELEKQGEYKTLLEETKSELEKARTKSEQWDSYQSIRRDALLSKLDEDDRELYDSLPLEKLEKVVEKNVNKSFVPDTDKSGAPRGGVQGYSTAADVMEDYRSGKLTNMQAQTVINELRKRSTA